MLHSLSDEEHAVESGRGGGGRSQPRYSGCQFLSRLLSARREAVRPCDLQNTPIATMQIRLQIRCIMQAMLRDISLTTSPNACAKIGSVSDHSGPSLVASPVSLFHSRRLQQTATADRDAGDRSEAITAVRSRGTRRAWLSGGLQHAGRRYPAALFRPKELGCFCVPRKTQNRQGLQPAFCPLYLSLSYRCSEASDWAQQRQRARIQP